MTSEADPEDYLDPVLSMKADYVMDSKPPQEYLNPDGHQYMPMDREPGKLELTLHRQDLLKKCLYFWTSIHYYSS